jgi:hypothetical protein
MFAIHKRVKAMTREDITLHVVRISIPNWLAETGINLHTFKVFGYRNHNGQFMVDWFKGEGEDPYDFDGKLLRHLLGTIVSDQHIMRDFLFVTQEPKLAEIGEFETSILKHEIEKTLRQELAARSAHVENTIAALGNI